ncbi:MAG: recombinase RecT [Lachnospiraceae bacterium]|nr:recombinase RecT [Ruminococcus sp.]MCM1277076.1 recombinase RecT [Lachnospiraceae bacterium]
MNTTNTNGIIAAAAEKAAPAQTKQKTPAQALNALLSNAAIQKQLQSTLKENSGAFATSLTNLFRDDNLLQQCDPKEVLGEGLKAAALKLPIEKQLGFAYIVPFKDHGVPRPQLQIGYKGYLQLAMRTGMYKYINAGSVYEGELRAVDKLTGEVDLSGEKISDKIIGYFAYIETVNGFKKAFYWTVEEVRKHADRYSKSYKSGAKIWKDNFHEMATKTVLRNLLSHYGVMSIEMGEALAAETEPAPPLPDDVPAQEVETTAEVSDTVPRQADSAPSGAPDEYPFAE